MGQGFKRMIKLYGEMKFNIGGEQVIYCWDWANDEAVEKKDFTKEMQAASERKKWQQLKNLIPHNSKELKIEK